MDDLSRLLSSESFMPHGHCYLWLPELLWLNVVSDALIALAYLTIPVTLIYLMRKRKDLPFNWVFAAFGIFILACGSTHVMDIWTIWHPDYWLSAFIKAITASASVVTAILLVKLVPAALRIPSQQQLAKLNDELRQANIELQEAQRELVARARQAGVAEIATNVLHSVGNVLNSVNVSAGVVSSQMRASKAPGLARAVQLMNEHASDLGDFLTRDEKGKQLPAYLSKLAEALAVEQHAIVEELGSLTRSVDHIKDIVATQQSYAGAASLAEPVQVRELVEDALRMHAEAFTRNQVTVVKEFADLPLLSLDRHRLLQILLNLIGNARQAMDTVLDREQRITLGVDIVDGTDERRLRIRVADDGEGIAPENLTRIFAHGFTTRKNGHGFGLHGSALAAKEMGGTLSAHSDGPGQGATFTLELPAQTGCI